MLLYFTNITHIPPMPDELKSSGDVEDTDSFMERGITSCPLMDEPRPPLTIPQFFLLRRDPFDLHPPSSVILMPIT